MTTSAAPEGAEQADRPASERASRLTPVNLVIAAVTILALGLRLFYLTRPGYLLGVTEYDDGSYFGSAVRLVHGVLPYRDFVFVQPPGITLLMAPAALVSRVIGTDGGIAIARLLTMLAGAAGVTLAGLLVRHRGVLAALVACGVVAVYPDSVSSSHTLLVEPWLVLFCLSGAVAVFDGDQITGSARRLIWGGVAFGFAGVIEAWAIIPVLVIVVLMVIGVRRPRRMAAYLGGVAAGFVIPVLPFAALAPRNFYDSVITAQVGGRVNAARMPLWYRLRQMSGFANEPHVRHLYVAGVLALIAAFVVVACAAALLLTRRLPPPVEWFAYGSAAAVVGIFLWPAQFHYHFSGFLAPFLGLSVALPAARLLAAILDRAGLARTGVPVVGQPGAAEPGAADRGPGQAPAGQVPPGQAPAVQAPAGRVLAGRVLRWSAAGLAAAGIVAGAWSQVSFESRLEPDAPVAMIAAGKQIIPAGACVLADNVAYTVVTNRFVSSVPGCPAIDDGTGANYALSKGRSTATGAGRVPAVAAMWRAAFGHAQYVWLTGLNRRRIAWTPALTAYFNANFVHVANHTHDLRLYVRKGLHSR
jgi:Glycosyltransferase family 87